MVVDVSREVNLGNSNFILIIKLIYYGEIVLYSYSYLRRTNKLLTRPAKICVCVPMEGTECKIQWAESTFYWYFLNNQNCKRRGLKVINDKSDGTSYSFNYLRSTDKMLTRPTKFCILCPRQAHERKSQRAESTIYRSFLNNQSCNFPLYPSVLLVQLQLLKKDR